MQPSNVSPFEWFRTICVCVWVCTCCLLIHVGFLLVSGGIEMFRVPSTFFAHEPHTDTQNTMIVLWAPCNACRMPASSKQESKNSEAPPKILLELLGQFLGRCPFPHVEPTPIGCCNPRDQIFRTCLTVHLTQLLTPPKNVLKKTADKQTYLGRF